MILREVWALIMQMLGKCSVFQANHVVALNWVTVKQTALEGLFRYSIEEQGTYRPTCYLVKSIRAVFLWEVELHFFFHCNLVFQISNRDLVEETIPGGDLLTKFLHIEDCSIWIFLSWPLVRYLRISVSKSSYTTSQILWNAHGLPTRCGGRQRLDCRLRNIGIN